MGALVCSGWRATLTIPVGGNRGCDVVMYDPSPRSAVSITSTMNGCVARSPRRPLDSRPRRDDKNGLRHRFGLNRVLCNTHYAKLRRPRLWICQARVSARQNERRKKAKPLLGQYPGRAARCPGGSASRHDERNYCQARCRFCGRLTSASANTNRSALSVAAMTRHFPSTDLPRVRASLDSAEPVARTPDRGRHRDRTAGTRAGRSARSISGAIASAVRWPHRTARKVAAQHLFDRRYGVCTEGFSEWDSWGLDDVERCGYMPCGIWTLPRALPARTVRTDDVFLDVGCGMGRIVLQAALGYRFRRVIGVELSPELCGFARDNVARIRHRLRCKQVELVQSDVGNYPIPTDVTVVFLYNPFGGSVFQRFVARLHDSIERNPRTVTVIYANPREEKILLAAGRTQLVKTLRGWRPTEEWSRSNSTRVYRISCTPTPS